MTKPSWDNEHGGHYFCPESGEGCIEYPEAPAEDDRRARAIQDNDIAGLVIKVSNRLFPGAYVDFALRYGIAAEMWDAGYRKGDPALLDSQTQREVPNVDDFRAAIFAERDRHADKGYTPEHDHEHGVKHLLTWAIEYARRGEAVKSSSLILAAMDLMGVAPMPIVSTCTCPSGDGSLRWPCPTHPPEPTEDDGKWSVRDTLTGAVYPQPNRLIAEKVAEMHGQSEIVPGWEGPGSTEDGERIRQVLYASNAIAYPAIQKVIDMLTAAGFRRQEPHQWTEPHLHGRWSNGDPVHIITDGTNRRVAPNLNGATWIPSA